MLGDGRWTALPATAFGVAIHNFVPLIERKVSEDAPRASAETVGELQIPLEVGMEVYCFESYASIAANSAAAASIVWYRGFTVSPAQPRLSTTQRSTTALIDLVGESEISGEPQVAVGIFPASHVQIREYMQDDQTSDVHLDSATASVTPSKPSASGALGPPTPNHRMESLQEEDEAEVIKISQTHNSESLHTPTKSRNRASVVSLQGSARLIFGPSAANGLRERPNPPLPNLKCGDETLKGLSEPLIDEIAGALREWTTLLYTHLRRRDYLLFESVRQHIDALHAGRTQLLAGDLSAAEIAQLRRDMVERLACGNVEQGLDVIVRNPTTGRLINVDADSEHALEDWLPVPEMYSLQVALAHMKNAARTRQARLAPSTALSPSLASPSSSFAWQSPQIGPQSSTKLAASSLPSKLYRIHLAFQSLTGRLCVVGETAELRFSLYSKADSRFISEEFCIVVDHRSQPVGSTRGTVFVELGQQDIRDQLFLICRVVKRESRKGILPSRSNGRIESAASPSLSSTHESEEDLSEITISSATSFACADNMDQPKGQTELAEEDDFDDSHGVRRPAGCGVVDISQLTLPELDGVASHKSSATLLRMPIFDAVQERDSALLHEAILASRIKDLEKSSRVDSIEVSCHVTNSNDRLRSSKPATKRLGFADVVLPGEERNDVYLKLWSANFSASADLAAPRGLSQLANSRARSVEVSVEVRDQRGSVVEGALHRGVGQAPTSRCQSIVLKGVTQPVWGELLKVSLPAHLHPTCHAFFTFRWQAPKDRSAPSTNTFDDEPFAFAALPLFDSDASSQRDGPHNLSLYRYDAQSVSPSAYLPAIMSPQPGDGQSVLTVLKDTFVVRTFLVSTRFTQDVTLLKMLEWESRLTTDDSLSQALEQLKFCPEIEVCKFLPALLDSLFAVLESKRASDGQFDESVYESLVTLLSLVNDRRFTNFGTVLDLYIQDRFSSLSAGSRIIAYLRRLLSRQHISEAATLLRSSLKIWKHIFRLIMKSRDLQMRASNAASSEDAADTFKSDLAAVMSLLNATMSATTPASVIGTQTLAVQHFASILPELSLCFDEQELTDMVIRFCDSIGSKVKVVWKLLLLRQIVDNPLFARAAARTQLVSPILRWLKPSLGRFEENVLCDPKDPQSTKDAARVRWIEGIRLGLSVLAAMFSVIQRAMLDPQIQQSRILLGHEHDNIEYLLGMVPRLLDSFTELGNLANVDAIERQRSVASESPCPPVVLPAVYPFALLSKAASSSREGETEDPGSAKWPSLQIGCSDAACVLITALHVASRKILDNWLEAMLEVEGKENFARFLSNLTRVMKAIICDEAFSTSWLNMQMLAHRTVLKALEPIADILERTFIPPQQASYTFNTALWRDIFTLLLRLLGSPHLLIETFSPQKRRCVWNLSGDLRAEGTRTLLRLWDAIGWPEHRQQGREERKGGYQVQFVPGLVEDVLAVCLSQHDELRCGGAKIMHSMVINEHHLADSISMIEAEVIDKLDRLYMSQAKGDDTSGTFFLGQLRALFDATSMDQTLHDQVEQFLRSIGSFLRLVSDVRSLPGGEQYQDDRIVSTLKLMNFIKSLGRTSVFIRYVQRLVSYHVATSSETEAGLALKLHADLYDWNLSEYADALPDLDLPRQTHFARKEALYMRVLDHLSKGKAWETALSLCKELQQEYESTNFDYARLADLLVLQAELYGAILKGDRRFGSYFRVAFYGTRFPLSISGKQFVYRATTVEGVEQFVQRMMDKHPDAQILQTSDIPRDEIHFADAQYLQITAVVPEPDPTTPMLANPEVPPYARIFFEQNHVNQFSFSRDFTKMSNAAPRSSTNDITTRWTEKTVLICEETFPTILKRTEVQEIRIIEFSPLENAIHDIQAKHKTLAELERRYTHVLQTARDRAQIDIAPLSLALNNILDAPQSSHVALYREAFAAPVYVAANPGQAGLLNRLHQNLDGLVLDLATCLKLHSLLCSRELLSFQESLERLFNRHFAEDIRRLPVSDRSLDTTHLATLDSKRVSRQQRPVPPKSAVNSHRRPGSISSSAADDASLHRRQSVASLQSASSDRTATPKRRDSILTRMQDRIVSGKFSGSRLDAPDFASSERFDPLSPSSSSVYSSPGDSASIAPRNARRPSVMSLVTGKDDTTATPSVNSERRGSALKGLWKRKGSTVEE